MLFRSTCEGATTVKARNIPTNIVSIHAPVKVRLVGIVLPVRLADVSIHAPVKVRLVGIARSTKRVC